MGGWESALERALLDLAGGGDALEVDLKEEGGERSSSTRLEVIGSEQTEASVLLAQGLCAK